MTRPGKAAAPSGNIEGWNEHGQGFRIHPCIFLKLKPRDSSPCFLRSRCCSDGLKCEINRYFYHPFNITLPLKLCNLYGPESSKSQNAHIVVFKPAFAFGQVRVFNRFPNTIVSNPDLTLLCCMFLPWIHNNPMIVPISTISI